MSKDRGQTVQTESTAQPWASQQPYLRDLFNRADFLYHRGPMQYYPGRTVAPQSQATLDSLSRQEQAAQSPNSIVGPQSQATLDSLNRQEERARSGNSLTAQARDLNQRTLAGDYLSADSNPYLRGAVDSALDDVQGRVNSTFGTGGGNNFGSSAHQEWLGRSLAERALPIYAQNYSQERNRQLIAQDRAPGLDTADINQLANVGAVRDAYQQRLTDADNVNMDRLGRVGAVRDTYSQSEIDADRARHDFDQMSPWDALQRYGTSITGNYGGTTTGTQPYYPSNPYMNLLGGGMAGMGMYGMGRDYGWWGGGGSGPTSGGGMDWNMTGDFGGGGYYG